MSNDSILPVETKELIARDRERKDHPELKLPTPEEVLGQICPVCHGTTWVIRANAELDATQGAPIMAQLEPCDNPNCAQTIKLGLRPIQHLALPANDFDMVVTRPNSSIVMALMKGEEKSKPDMQQIHVGRASLCKRCHRIHPPGPCQNFPQFPTIFGSSANDPVGGKST